MGSSSECENELHDEAHGFLESFLEHVPTMQDYFILLVATHPDETDNTKLLVSATKHASEGMGSDTIKTMTEALINLLTQERGEDDTAYATRH